MRYQLSYRGFLIKKNNIRIPLIKYLYGVFEISLRYINYSYLDVYINRLLLVDTKSFQLNGNYIQLQLLHCDKKLFPTYLDIIKQPTLFDYPIQFITVTVKKALKQSIEFNGLIQPLSIGHRFYFPMIEPFYDEYLEMEYIKPEIHIQEYWEYYLGEIKYSFIQYVHSLYDLQKILYPFVTTINNDKLHIFNPTPFIVKFNEAFKWYCDLSHFLPSEERVIVLKEPTVIVEFNRVEMLPSPYINKLGVVTSPTLEFTFFNFQHKPIDQTKNNPVLKMQIYSKKNNNKQVDVNLKNITIYN